MRMFTLRNARLVPFFITIPYFIFVLLLLIPVIQRNAFYANRVNPALWQSLDNVEQFGFYGPQVQPFTYSPPNEPDIRLYAWHVLPLPVYLDNEVLLKSSQNETHQNAPISIMALLSGPSFRLLLDSPTAHLVITLHGNAAHLASAHRPATIQNLLSLSTPTHPVHVLALDYRGFGLSTGSPTETGLTADVVTLLEFLRDAKFPMSRITLLGTSLGTAVATSVFHTWTLTLRQPAFHSLILIASFSSVPSLLDGYSLKGLVPPLLSGLDYFPPSVKNFVLSRICDPWPTASRLRDLWLDTTTYLDISILHAQNDHEIPWREGWENFRAVMDTNVGTFSSIESASPITSLPKNAGTTINGNEVETYRSWLGEVSEEKNSVDKAENRKGKRNHKRISWDLIKHGGHNRIAVSEQMKGVVWRALNQE